MVGWKKNEKKETIFKWIFNVLEKIQDYSTHKSEVEKITSCNLVWKYEIKSMLYLNNKQTDVNYICC